MDKETDKITNPELDIDWLLKILSHRYPFFMIDRVLDLDPGKKIKALKNVTINEPYFQGHFPEKPIMPGVMVVESMAQAGAVLIHSSLNNPKKETFYLGGIDRARFRKPVRPGDQLIIDMEITRSRSRLYKVKGECLVCGEKVADGEFLAVMEKGVI